MKKYVFFLVLISSISCKSQNDGHVQVIDMDTFKTEVIGKDVQLLDVRTEREYNQGHIDDAINIDILHLYTFKKEVKKLDKSKPVYIYCQVGGRSKQAGKELETLGFQTIYDYSGGYSEWNNQ